MCSRSKGQKDYVDDLARAQIEELRGAPPATALTLCSEDFTAHQTELEGQLHGTRQQLREAQEAHREEVAGLRREVHELRDAQAELQSALAQLQSTQIGGAKEREDLDTFNWKVTSAEASVFE